MKLKSILLLFVLYYFSLAILHIHGETVEPSLQKVIENRTGNILMLENKKYDGSGVTIPKGVTIIGKKNTTIEVKQSPITVQSEVKIIGVKITGGKSNFALIIPEETKNVLIKKCDISNIIGDGENFVAGIFISNKTDSIQITENFFHDIPAKYENNIIGDPIGAVRAIYIQSGKNILIQKNTFKNIGGFEDGDSIHIQTRLSNSYYTNSDVSICYNTFIAIKKRAIKIQASQVNIISNNFYNSNLLTHTGIYGEFSKKLLVSKNKIHTQDVYSGIHFHHIQDSSISENEIEVIRDLRKNGQYSLLFENTKNLLVLQNNLSNNRITLINTKETILKENKFLFLNGIGVSVKNSSNTKIITNRFSFINNQNIAPVMLEGGNKMTQIKFNTLKTKDSPLFTKFRGENSQTIEELNKYN